MKLVLDTNAYCLCDRALPAALEALERSQNLYLPTIVYGELYYGFKYSAQFPKSFKRLEKFIAEFDVALIHVDEDVARKFGDIFAALRKRGKPIPTNDIWIAACCMSVGGTLLTADAHFREIGQIQVEFLPTR